MSKMEQDPSNTVYLLVTHYSLVFSINKVFFPMYSVESLQTEEKNQRAWSLQNIPT